MKKSIIQKTTGKGTPINEVPKLKSAKYLSEYERIFGKKGAGK
jgi:hypothetical protein